VASLDQLLSSTLLARLQELIAEEPDAVVSLIDADLCLVWVDEIGAVHTYARKPAEYEGRPAVSFVDPLQAVSFATALRTALAGETTRFAGRASAGDGRWLQVSSIMWPTVDRQHVVTISVVTDPSGAS